MRTPVKLNRSYWPRILTALLPSADDPRILLNGTRDPMQFARAVSTFKFGTTYKTTEKSRFPLSIQALAALHRGQRPIILDVGASDGTTSMDVIQAIPFRKYFVTDRHLQVFSSTEAGNTYFYTADAKCALIASAAWVIYEDTTGALPPFGAIARRVFAQAPTYGGDEKTINLVNPWLTEQSLPNVRVEHYDIFDRWPGEKVDLVIAANILNRAYFSDDRLVHAVKNLIDSVKDDGRMAIIDNRDIEKATIFSIARGLPMIEQQINGGTEVESLVMQVSAERTRSAATGDAR